MNFHFFRIFSLSFTRSFLLCNAGQLHLNITLMPTEGGRTSLHIIFFIFNYQLPVMTLLKNPTVAIVMLLAKCHRIGGLRNFRNIHSIFFSTLLFSISHSISLFASIEIFQINHTLSCTLAVSCTYNSLNR